MYISLQPLRRHVAFGGIESEGSSESGSGVVAAAAFGIGVGRAALAAEMGVVTGAAFSLTRFANAALSISLGSSFGVSSTVECLPVVHGGMFKNSSNVRTRGLQHFQPIHKDGQEISEVSAYILKIRKDLYSPFWPSWKTGGPG